MYWYIIVYFSTGLQSKLSQLLLIKHVLFLVREDAGDTQESKGNEMMKKRDRELKLEVRLREEERDIVLAKNMTQHEVNSVQL